MEKASPLRVADITRTYYLITKPGILFGNAITTAGGFALASRGYFDLWFFLAALVGLSLVIASASTFNNYIDRDLDRKMARTRHRPLAQGLLSGPQAIAFAVVLGLLGAFLLAFFVHFLAAAIALFGFFVYVVLYSFLKYRSVHATLIGSIAGATPPVVGYSAVSGTLDTGAALLFLTLVFWQMPHFYAIAIYRMEDYRAASIPVLPIQKGIYTTKIQMLLYIAAFIGISSLLTFFHYAGYAYLVTALLVGSYWFWLCIKGFSCTTDRLWARKMFLFSLVVILALNFVILFEPISINLFWNL